MSVAASNAIPAPYPTDGAPATLQPPPPPLPPLVPALALPPEPLPPVPLPPLPAEPPLPPAPPSGRTVNEQTRPPQVAPSALHLQSAVVLHQPSLVPDMPAVLASVHVAPPELLVHTWLPHVVPGQSLSVSQAGACACALPAARTPARPARPATIKDHRFLTARGVIGGGGTLRAQTIKSGEARQD
jgi:hypothetical protein